MSKRFGRNQKRKLNAALKIAQRDLVITSETLALVRHNSARDAKSVQIMHDLFGDYFMALEPKKVTVSDDVIDSGYFEMVKKEPFDHDSLHQNMFESVSDATFRRLNLDIVESKSFFDFMSCRVHVLLETRSGRVAYSATPEAIAGMNSDQLVSCIVGPMCSRLISQFKSMLKGGKNAN